MIPTETCKAKFTKSGSNINFRDRKGGEGPDGNMIVNRPGVAEDFLQTPLSLID